MLHADHALAQRLERTEARSNAAFVEARARQQPGSGVIWQQVAGAYALFDGVGSPLTQTFGLGLFEAVGDAELSEIEQFFSSAVPPSCTKSAQHSHAAAQGCTVAMMGALPGSQSQRNAETQGFRVAYTRTKWQLGR